MCQAKWPLHLLNENRKQVLLRKPLADLLSGSHVFLSAGVGPGSQEAPGR